ncbi:von Willebrand factor D and EGF domain-containing protein [Thelohanellus kitauei]|uniref:von Willebrand factor D and EGF domain-containing protein n=1 Tax=Thelohanellus kitauei TaxID=669202 RepID=A0A0C2IX45_THEKT|nr:von Willebrand factor D and EGF domain-containing protein [Thelohanellus kitauei]
MPGYYGLRCEHIACNITCVNQKCLTPYVCNETCKKGWSGTNCSIPICNGYTKCSKSSSILKLLTGCQVVDNKRTCICNRNHFGEYCQFKCPNPCNNGYCMSMNGGIRCVCSEGFYGVSCSKSCKNKIRIQGLPKLSPTRQVSRFLPK